MVKDDVKRRIESHDSSQDLDLGSLPAAHDNRILNLLTALWDISSSLNFTIKLPVHLNSS